MASQRDIIQEKAIEEIGKKEEGIRYKDLMKFLEKNFEGTPFGTLTGSIWNLDATRPDKVYKPARGLFKHIKYQEVIDKKEEVTTPKKKGKVEIEKEAIKEKEIYEPFVDYITNDLEECTRAISLGGNKFKDKWGTPDVVGKKEARKSDIIKFETEIVSAEIKIDTSQLIVAFGQACSYLLFSHKSYIVIPTESSEDDIAKLDSLCQIFGIGLILFKMQSKEVEFSIRVRATRRQPDMFYLNQNMELIENELFN